MNLLFTVKEYIRYYFKAKNLHGVHSPFVYKFNEEVVNDKRNFYPFAIIENFRKELLNNNNFIAIEDFGAGSNFNNSTKKTISEIAKTAGRKKKHGEVLFKIVNHYQPTTILELGTSLGIGTTYLAMANKSATVHTIEGSKEIYNQAKLNFANLQLNNVQNYLGKFDEVLPNLLPKIKELDLVFIDGNHAYEPTLNYFKMVQPYLSKNAIVIFDDIYWSSEMAQAWQQIVNNPSALLTIDLFQFGLVVYNINFKQKQHEVVKL